MIPVLFKKNEQQFRTYGLGEITDIINPKVTRERNGQYMLYFQYPQDAEFSDVFEEDMRIKSDAGVRTKWQTFEISRVVRKEGQLIEVFAKHISQSLLKDALNPSVSVISSDAEQALRTWNSNRIGDEEFDVWSDITTTNSTNWNIQDVSNAFEALAGVQGSILDVWGGEYEFDNTMIRLHKEMGRKSPVPLEYGRNITGLEQDRQEDNIYTSIYPFATYTLDGDDSGPKTVTLPEYYVDGKYIDMYPKRKIRVVDFSGEFEHDVIPTVDRLRTLANRYAETNEVGLPHENLKVEYIDLSKTLDYQEFQTMEEVELNDILPIFYPKFGITNENAKVVIVIYDPVKEENISIELGVIGQSFRTVTTGGIGSRLDRIEKQQDETTNYIVNNKGNRIWFETPDKDMEHKIGDTWFEKNGPYDRIRVWNGNQWETIIDSEDIDKNAREIEAVIEQAEADRLELEEEIDNSLSSAKAHADAEVQASKEHFDGVLAEVESDVAGAQATADSAVEQIDTAVANAGFTSLDDTFQNIRGVKSELDLAIENAGFESLDDTLQNMNHITMNAEQSAQEAITNASNAHDLAQTSISEAQTAQENSLTALSEAKDALEGVSSLNVRVDEVKGELESKADNTFLTEDGEVITLSNAITLNAHKFSSDMSRIESRVESLVGEINLVILRDAFEGTRLIGGEVFPNATEAPNTINNDTMAEMINVEAGEQLALSKETTDNDNFWRINFYLNDSYVSRMAAGDNEYIVTVPSGVNQMWVSYPKGSKPQIIRGTAFLSYRSSIADQMTTDEMVIFRNEYDEYADRTERRLTAIDSTGGSLDVLNNKITTEANSVRSDMTAYIETKVGNNTFAEFYQNEYLETAQEVSRKISLSDVRVGGRNLIKNSSFYDGFENWSRSSPIAVVGEIPGVHHPFVRINNVLDYSVRVEQNVDVESATDYIFSYSLHRKGSVILAELDGEGIEVSRVSINKVGEYSRYSHELKTSSTTRKLKVVLIAEPSEHPLFYAIQLEKGNVLSDWKRAFEDSDAQLNHIQTEWTQTFDTFDQTVSDIDGRVTTQKQTIDTISGTVSGHDGRLSTVEQTASGLQSQVFDSNGNSRITQLASGIQSVVNDLDNLEIGGRNLLVKSGEGYAEGYSVGGTTPGNPPYYTIREYDAISNHIDVTNEGVEDYYTFSKQDSLITDDQWFRIYWISKNGGVIRRDVSNENVFTTKKPENAVTLRFSFPKDSMAKVEKGNIATGYSEAPEDTDAKIGHVQTEWSQAHNAFKQTVSDDFGTVNYNVQTLENSLSAITNPVTGRLSVVEQVAGGLQETVMDTTTGLSATRIQMAEGFSQMVSSNFIRKRNFEDGTTGNWGGQGITENLGSLGYINGMTKAFKWATRNAFEEGNVFDVSPGETYYVEFVVNTYFAKYPVRFGLNTYGPLGENVGFNAMIEVPIGQPTQKVTGTITIPTTGPNTPYTKARPLLQIYGPNGSDLGFAYVTALAISPNANNSQITQLQDNINLRVSKDDVINQINVSTEGILIDGNKTHITGTTTIDKGVIKDAHISDLHADKINAGKINTARLNANEIITKGLTANVIKSTHIQADTALFDKLFTSTLATDRLSAQRAWIKNANIANASISGVKIEDASIVSAKIAQLDVAKITGGTTTFVRSNWNSINSRANINANRLKFTHADGTSTEIGSNGLRRVTPNDSRNYHYLISIHTFIYGESSNRARWVQLPDDFKGKKFKVYMALADTMNVANYKRVLQRIVATQHPKHDIDYANARVPVIAYKSESLGDGTAPNITSVQGMLIAIY